VAVHVSKAVAAFIQSVGLTAAPRPATEWLVELSDAYGWAANAEEAREWAERVQGRFLEALRRETNELTEGGRFAPFAFNSSSEYVLQGCAFAEPRDPPDLKAAKARRARYDEYVSALRNLGPQEFERLCAGILRLVGVSNAQLTRRTGDEGIDFSGRLPLGQYLFPGDVFPTIQNQLAVWMIGQAKRYEATVVSTPAIRELVGSVELAKGRAIAEPVDEPTDDQSPAPLLGDERRPPAHFF